MAIDWSQRVVDVSYSQGDCDFTAMQATLAPTVLSGAIVKISEGAYVYDPHAIHNVWAMGFAQLRWQMLYHFVRNDPAPMQFDHLIQQVETWLGGMVDRRCLWLDIENHGPSDTPIDIYNAIALLALCVQRWPGRVGWYAPRSIANELLDYFAIARDAPRWIAAPGADLDLVAIDYGACLVQYGEEPLSGTTGNPNTLIDAVALPDILDALCHVPAQQQRKEPSMILFQVPNDVYLWDGSALVGLGGLGSVYSTLVAAGVPQVDATQGEGQAFYDRLTGAHKTPGAKTLTGTITVPAQKIDLIVS